MLMVVFALPVAGQKPVNPYADFILLDSGERLEGIVSVKFRNGRQNDTRLILNGSTKFPIDQVNSFRTVMGDHIVHQRIEDNLLLHEALLQRIGGKIKVYQRIIVIGDYEKVGKFDLYSYNGRLKRFTYSNVKEDIEASADGAEFLNQLAADKKGRKRLIKLVMAFNKEFSGQ